MLRTLKAVASLVALVALCQVAAMASGSRVPSASTPVMTPEERAAESYNSGIDHKNKGVKYEEQAAAASEKDRAKLVEKAQKEFGNALKDFKRAADTSPKMYQAFNGMGYAFRKTGDYAKALEMYDKALELAPGFPDAVEYRGEAYLALNRLDDAKQAYMTLFGSDRAQADILMNAMKKYVDQRKAEPAGVDPAALSAFEKWIQERNQIALDTRAMALTGRSANW